MNRRFTGLWRHPDFMKLWVGQSISELGSRISRDGIPLIAVIVLAATPEQVGLLTALSAIPVLIVGLFAGVWVDRLRRRPVMIVADMGRALLLLTIPLAALIGRLSLPLLIVVAALMGVLGLFFDLAYRAALPWLVARENVLEGNSKLTTTESLAEIGGPALAGLLIQMITAPFAILVDGLSFVISVITLAAIRKDEPLPCPAETRESWQVEIRQGLQVVIQQPVLRTLALGSSVRSFFGAFFSTLYGIYVLRDLHFTPAGLGLLISAGGVGALLGALLTARIPRQIPIGHLMTSALLISGLVNLLIPLAMVLPPLAFVLLLIPQVIGDAAMVFYNINEITLRQTIIPDDLLGRTGATISLLSQGIVPLGALCGGLLAARLGTGTTLLIAVCGMLGVALWMPFSPLATQIMQGI